MRTRKAWLLALLAMVVFWSTRAFAHDEMVSASRVEVGDRAIVWKVDIGIDGLRKVIPLPQGDLGEAALDERRDAIAGYLLGALAITADGRPLAGKASRVDPIYEPSIVTGAPRVARVLVELVFTSPESIRAARAKVSFFSEVTSVHRAVIAIHRSGKTVETMRLGPGEVDLGAEPVTSSRWITAKDFGIWGIRHIFSGYDHIAFLLGLLLATVRFRDVIKIVSAFTLAHSVTLLVSALGIISLPARLTESMIAISIVYVAAENVFGARAKPHRWVMAFGFGLVHGLGFASDLRERLAASGTVLVPVVSFNVGVELGQLAIVMAVLPLLVLIRKHWWTVDDRSAAIPTLRLGSLPILGLGLYWLVERALG
jgi:hydrogenase/urease accessory protein HupE